LKIGKLEGILNEVYGDLGWWPGESEDEIVIGAILTQNTTWSNVTQAMNNLRRNGLNSLKKLEDVSSDILRDCIRPAGFHNQKAAYLKGVAAEISKRGGLAVVHEMSDADAKKFLISLKGIGNETMEDILLYTLNRKVFVKDKYAIRLFSRMGFPEGIDDLSVSIEEEFSLERIKNFHGCIVELCKEFCRSTPKCGLCPVNKFCEYYEKVFTEP
jgi:Uncharacterized protein related to Endonuclease III